MEYIELLLIGIGLSMDAFAVSVCKGLSIKKLLASHYLSVGLWFGGFQALMLLFGYLLGSTFEMYIAFLDHWIAFVLLGLIGSKMIKESFSYDCSISDKSFNAKRMFFLALATSIDALAVGITLALLPHINISVATLFIGLTTCVVSILGIQAGNLFGLKYKSKAEFAGGLILILIGLKILIQHLFSLRDITFFL
ncbi:MAG: manganese efflux pump MntP family protein [Treponemataceae bacterium]